MFELILLDRDGVLNMDRADFIKSPTEWEPIIGSAKAVSLLNQANTIVALCTNQSGLARGYFDVAGLDAIHQTMQEHLATQSAKLDGIYYCPHGPDDGCDCRKPAPGLLQRAMLDFAIAPENACFVGDSLRDLEAAAAAGCQPVLVRTGNGAATERRLTAKPSALANTPTFDDLAHAVDYLLGYNSRA